MKTFVLGLAATLFAAVALGSICLSAQDDLSISQLLAMLRYVPSEGAVTESSWATVRFVDYEALFESEGLTLFRDRGSVNLLMTAVHLGTVFGRIAASPEALTNVFASSGQMADVVGFEWLLDVDCSLEFGAPPAIGLMLGGDFDATKIGTALEARGFTLANIQGVPVWHRFEDSAISLAARDLADPFGGHLGAAARLALFPDALGNARTWSLIEPIINAAQSTQTSLADDPVYRTLAEAVSESEGLLIQALFFSEDALRLADDSVQTASMSTENPEALPHYLGAVLADRQEGVDQVHLIGLVCADMAAAQAAAVVLARRVEEFRPLSIGGYALVDRFGATVTIREVRELQNALAVAVAEVRYPVPAEPVDPETDQYYARGLLFRYWVHSVLAREFTPLQ